MDTITCARGACGGTSSDIWELMYLLRPAECLSAEGMLTIMVGSARERMKRIHFRITTAINLAVAYNEIQHAQQAPMARISRFLGSVCRCMAVSHYVG